MKSSDEASTAAGADSAPRLKQQQKKTNAKQQGGFGRAYWRRAYGLLDSRMEPLYKRFSGIEDQVRKAGIRLTYRVYLCGVVFTAILWAVIGGVVSGLIAAVAPSPLALKIVIPLTVALGGGALTFVVGLFYPRIRFGGRKRKIDEDLVFIVSRMAVLSASGMTPENIMRQIAQEDSNDLITQEFRKMVRDMNLLGMDITQALERRRDALHRSCLPASWTA